MYIYRTIMDFFESHTELSETSIKMFNGKLNEWISFFPIFTQSLSTLLLYPEYAMQVLNTHIKTNTNSNKHLYLMAVLSFLRHRRSAMELFPPHNYTALRAQWVQIHYENEAPLIQRRLENKPTDLQAKKGGSRLTYDQIVSIRDQLANGSIEHLLVCMYTMIPPVRADYYAMRIVLDDGSGAQEIPWKNYLLLRADGSAQSVLRDFKTAKKFGQIVNELPAELVAVVKKSLEMSPREYLFLNANGKPHTRNSFTLWSRRTLSRVFGTDFTLVFFRHAFSTHYTMSVDLRTMTDAQIKEMSDRMGHSAEMFRAYRWVQAGGVGTMDEEETSDAEEEKE